MRSKHKIVILAALIFGSIFLYLSVQHYGYPEKAELQHKINYLEKFVNQPFNNNSELEALRKQNPEWILFSLSFTVYALTNITMKDTSFRHSAITIIDKAIQKATSDTIYQYYSEQRNPLYPNIDTTGSILYLGHLNMMLACYRLLSPECRYDELHDKLSASLYQRYSKSKYHSLPSYSSNIWIADNTVGLASLYLHSQITGSKYKSACTEWVKYAKQHFIDSKTGLLCSKIDEESGKMIEASRGSMIGWCIFFIFRFDSEFAQKQFELFKSEHSKNLGIIRLFKERSGDFTTDKYGDIDSGPLFMGYSIPANAFAFGDAVALDDKVNAQRLKRLINLGSKSIKSDDEIHYKVRYIDLPISPLSEALLLYFETMSEWDKINFR